MEVHKTLQCQILQQKLTVENFLSEQSSINNYMKAMYLAETISWTATGWHSNCIDLNIEKIMKANKQNDASKQMTMS